jgi:hypothetical protein
MDLKPSTYYLDRIKSFSSELAESQAQQQKATLEQQQQTEKAAKAVAEAEQKKRDERTAFVKQLYSQGFGETMWGQHKDIVRQMREGMNERLDEYVSNPDQFYRDLGQMRGFIEQSKDYYNRTSKSASEAFARSSPGANNPYEREGLIDQLNETAYQNKLQDLQAPAMVNFSGEQFEIDGRPIDEYSSTMFTQDPFSPILTKLPEFSPEEVYQLNTKAFLQNNRDKWETVANGIVDVYMNKDPQRMIGDINPNETSFSIAARIEEARKKFVGGLLEQARQTQQ